MSNVEKISVALSSDLVKRVRTAVDSGRYSSASEVIREALREWSMREPLREAEIKRLRSAWNEGISSGAPQPFDMDEIKSKARARLNDRRSGA